jgi:hypothetical protein
VTELRIEELTSMMQKLMLAESCKKHDRLVLSICINCGRVACSICFPVFCQCENDE